MKREEEQQKNGSWGWLYGITAGACVAAMQIGVGMFQMEQDLSLIHISFAGEGALSENAGYWTPAWNRDGDAGKGRL